MNWFSPANTLTSLTHILMNRYTFISRFSYKISFSIYRVVLCSTKLHTQLWNNHGSSVLLGYYLCNESSVNILLTLRENVWGRVTPPWLHRLHFSQKYIRVQFLKQLFQCLVEQLWYEHLNPRYLIVNKSRRLKSKLISVHYIPAQNVTPNFVSSQRKKF